MVLLCIIVETSAIQFRGYLKVPSPSQTSFLRIVSAEQPLVGALLLFIGRFCQLVTYFSICGLSDDYVPLLFSDTLPDWPYKHFCRNTGVFTAKTLKI